MFSKSNFFSKLPDFLVILFSLFLITSAGHANYDYKDLCKPKYYLISDFDNTIKSYSSFNLPTYVMEAIWSNDIFPAIDTLYKEITSKAYETIGNSCQYNPSFSIITASPKTLHIPVNHLLSTNNFPNYDIFSPLKPVP